MIELIAGALAYKGDHWAGDGKKWLGYIFLAIAIMFPALYPLGDYFLYLIPYCILCALCLRKWGAWGELFVNTNKEDWGKHEWIKRLVNKIYRENYDYIADERLKQWKVLGWAVRYSIYALPIGALYCVASMSLTPLLFLPIAGLVRGCVYWYGLINYDLGWCERWGGMLSMIVLTGSL